VSGLPLGRRTLTFGGMELTDEMLDRIQHVMHRVAKIVADYERDLISKGMESHKAYGMARALQERLLGTILDAADPDAMERYDPKAAAGAWPASLN